MWPSRPERGSATRRLIGALLLLSALAALGTTTALANGGTIQLADQPVGPYAVTVFTSPSPLRVGTADVSVLVVRAGTNDAVLDAQVRVTTEPVGHDGPGGSFEATHAQATNKLLYAANVSLPSDGPWRLTVAVAGPEGGGSAAFTVDVSPAILGLSTLELACLTIPALGVIAFVLLTWLPGRRKARAGALRRPATPRASAPSQGEGGASGAMQQ